MITIHQRHRRTDGRGLVDGQTDDMQSSALRGKNCAVIKFYSITICRAISSNIISGRRQMIDGFNPS